MTAEEVKAMLQEQRINATEMVAGHYYLMLIPRGTMTINDARELTKACLDFLHVRVLVVSVDDPEEVQLFEVAP